MQCSWLLLQVERWLQRLDLDDAWRSFPHSRPDFLYFWLWAGARHAAVFSSHLASAKVKILFFLIDLSVLLLFIQAVVFRAIADDSIVVPEPFILMAYNPRN